MTLCWTPQEMHLAEIGLVCVDLCILGFVSRINEANNYIFINTFCAVKNLYARSLYNLFFVYNITNNINGCLDHCIKYFIFWNQQLTKIEFAPAKYQLKLHFSLNKAHFNLYSTRWGTKECTLFGRYELQTSALIRENCVQDRTHIFHNYFGGGFWFIFHKCYQGIQGFLSVCMLMYVNFYNLTPE